MTLDILLRTIAYSIIVIPIAILIIGAILYHYKPIHRLTVGIILVTLGGLGLAIYSGVFYLTTINNGGNLGPFITLTLVTVEVFTLCIGIKSLTQTKNKAVQ